MWLPEFVPLIDMDHIDSDEITDVAIRYLQPLLKQRKIRLAFIGKSAEGTYYSKVKGMIDSINSFDSFVQIRERNDYRSLKIYKKGKRKDKISKLSLKPYNPVMVSETPPNAKYYNHDNDLSIVAGLFEDYKAKH